MPQLNGRRACADNNGSGLVCLTIVKAAVKLFKRKGVDYEESQVFGFGFIVYYLLFMVYCCVLRLLMTVSFLNNPVSIY
jgi:hypothetical protein